MLKIELSDKEAKALKKIAWMTISACNSGEDGEVFQPNQEMIKELGLSLEDISGLYKFVQTINKS